MKRPLLLLLLMVSLGTPAWALDAGQQAVAKMGELNGVALACRWFEEVRRIKRALIDNLPKQRELGEIFEDRTNQSFQGFVGSGQPCPSPAGFSAELDQAIETLEEAFDVH